MRGGTYVIHDNLACLARRNTVCHEVTYPVILGGAHHPPRHPAREMTDDVMAAKTTAQRKSKPCS